jgi:hypothetical protein
MGAFFSPSNVNGNLFWRNSKGQIHRKNDLPAAIYQNGDRCWYKYGKLTRANDLPARILSNGTQIWSVNGVLYRDYDKPAVVLSDGTCQWYKNGKLHRDDYLPAIKYLNEVCEYWKYGKKLSLERLIECYKIIGRFGRRSLLIARLRKYKRVANIHAELMVLPPRGTYLGGQKYLHMLEKYA